jgi:hypothetical protein
VQRVVEQDPQHLRHRVRVSLRPALVAVLEHERDEAAELEPFGVDGQGGAIGGASVGLERATSAVEPSIGDYDDEDLRAAFAADEGCEHVIQPF